MIFKKLTRVPEVITLNRHRLETHEMITTVSGKRGRARFDGVLSGSIHPRSFK